MKVIELPVANVEPFSGWEMAVVGAVLPVLLTVTVIEEEPVRPPLSVADAVMVWTPADNDDVETLPPLAIVPSIEDVQVNEAVKSPSWLSIAVPLKVIGVPAANVKSVAGESIDKVGAVFAGSDCVGSK